MTTFFNQTTAPTFHAALRFAQELYMSQDTHSDTIKARSREIYKNTDIGIALTNPHKPAEFYLSEDSLSGFAVRADGELCGVFSLVRGRGHELVSYAKLRGATTLNCFEGFLSDMYAKHGFIVVGSERNYGGDHLPRVVFMALKSETV